MSVDLSDSEDVPSPAGRASRTSQAKSHPMGYRSSAATLPVNPTHTQNHMGGYEYRGAPMFSSYSQQMVPYYDYRNPFAPVPTGGAVTGAAYFGGLDGYHDGRDGYYGGPMHMRRMYGRPPAPPEERLGPVNASRQRRTRAPDAHHEIVSQNTGDAVLNPSSKRDMTIHLELEIEDDIESKITEVASLKRMGRFRDAHAYFRANLSEHLEDSIPTMVEYADMLLAQGHFDRIFESFDEDAITKSCLEMPLAKLAADQVNLVLVLQLARSYSDPNLQTALNVAEMASKFLQSRPPRNSHDCIPSTELQVLCRYLNLTSCIRKNSNILWAANSDFRFDWGQWVGLYRNLMDESRHWELRDIMVSFVSTFGAPQASASLLGEDSLETGISKLLNDWERTVVAETSDLCLLDIMVCFCRKFIRKGAPMRRLENFLFQRGRAVAASVKERNQQSVKCRPYLEWILLEEERVRVRRSCPDGKEESTAATVLVSPPFRKLPGWTVWSGVLPSYAPTASENPGWPPVVGQGTKLSDELLELVLRVSEEQGDFATQVSCLRELVCRSREPSSLFAKLEHLQLFVMGDKLGTLKTKLSKYLLTADDDASRRALKDELVDMDPRLQRWRADFACPLIQWCHLRILHALMLSTGSAAEELRNAEVLADTLKHQLPQNFLAKLNYRLPSAPRLVAPPIPTTPVDDDVQTTGDEQGSKKKKVTIDEDVHNESVSSDSSHIRTSYGRGYGPTPPPGPPPRSSTKLPREAFNGPPPPPVDDPEVKALKAKLDAFEKEREQRKKEEERKELEQKVRRDAEEALRRRMEELRRVQEEARQEIERARAETERAAREKMEAERKTEEERRRSHAETIARAEREAREKLLAEFKAAEERKRRQAEAEAEKEAIIQARVGAKLAEAIKAREDAAAAAAKKASEEAALRKKIEEEATIKAEKAAEAKIAEAVAAAVAKTRAEITGAVSQGTKEPEENGQVG